MSRAPRQGAHVNEVHRDQPRMGRAFVISSRIESCKSAVGATCEPSFSFRPKSGSLRDRDAHCLRSQALTGSTPCPRGAAAAGAVPGARVAHVLPHAAVVRPPVPRRHLRAPHRGARRSAELVNCRFSKGSEEAKQSHIRVKDQNRQCSHIVE